MKWPKLRVRHLIELVAACAALFGVLQYRWRVYDRAYEAIRQARYANADGRLQAIRELGGGGPPSRETVEALVAALQDQDPHLRAEAATSLGSRLVGRGGDPQADAAKSALTQRLRDGDPQVRVQAAIALSRIGVQTGPVLASLIEASRNAPKWDRGFAIDLLASRFQEDTSAQAAVLAALADRDPDIRLCGARSLSWWARNPHAVLAETTFDTLVAGLKDQSTRFRGVCAQSLGAFGARAAKAVPHLVEAMEDPKPEVRMTAALALGSLRSTARPAVPALTRKLADPDALVRRSVAVALSVLGVAAEDALPALRGLDDDPDPAVRRAASESAQKIEKAARNFHDELLPELTSALGDDDRDGRIRAAESLAEFGPSSRAGVPALMHALDDPEPEVRRAAAIALRRIQGEGPTDSILPK